MKVFDWAKISSDLNSNENLLSYIKNKVEEKQRSSAKELVTTIKEVWVKEINTEEKGGHTKYYKQSFF